MKKKVVDLRAQCSLQIRNFGAPGIAMSDCCGKRANSVVKMSNGALMYRCLMHEGIVTYGPSYLEIEVKDATD